MPFPTWFEHLPARRFVEEYIEPAFGAEIFETPTSSLGTKENCSLIEPPAASLGCSKSQHAATFRPEFPKGKCENSNHSEGIVGPRSWSTTAMSVHLPDVNRDTPTSKSRELRGLNNLRGVVQKGLSFFVAVSERAIGVLRLVWLIQENTSDELALKTARYKPALTSITSLVSIPTRMPSDYALELMNRLSHIL